MANETSGPPYRVFTMVVTVAKSHNTHSDIMRSKKKRMIQFHYQRVNAIHFTVNLPLALVGRCDDVDNDDGGIECLSQPLQCHPVWSLN